MIYAYCSAEQRVEWSEAQSPGENVLSKNASFYAFFVEKNYSWPETGTGRA